MTAGSVRRALPVPLPRSWGVRPSDVVAALVGNGVFIILMWLRHGGLGQVSTPGGAFIAVGQLAALFGTYLALIQLVLMARTPWLDQVFGMDRLIAAHRWIGFATVWLIVAHGLATTVGYAASERASVVGEAWTILSTFDWVLPATVGFAIFVLVAVTSMRFARRRLAYDRWFLLHLLSYLAIALAFLHQLVLGGDFLHDPIARVYWSALYVVAVGLILVFRLGAPIRLNLRHRFRVAQVTAEGPGVVSIYVTGRDLDRLPVRSGQYFTWRFLDGRTAWAGHPLSLSAAPNGHWLRTTVKALGDDTRRFQRLKPGTRVLLEGPFGVLTGLRRRRRKVTLIAGGIGVTPLRALLEALPGRPGDLTLVYRVRASKHLVLADEIEAVARHRGAVVHQLVGRRGSPELPSDPLGERHLLRLIPDLADHDVYVCGPDAMMRRVTEALRRLGVPPDRIHLERFVY